MRRISTFLMLTLFSSLIVLGQGTNVVTAVAVSPTGTATGIISDQWTHHYWKVTTTVSGYLRVQTTSNTNVDVDLSIYDVNGTSYLTGDSRSGTTSEAFLFIKPGTYFVVAYRGGGSGGAYTLTTTFLTPARSGDAEPNDSPSTALVLAPTGTATGHIGFFGSGTGDDSDYWKVTTTQDGWLRIQIRGDSLDLRGDVLLDIDLSVFDVNASSYITGDSRLGTFSQAAAFLRPGTYFVKPYRANGRAGSYEIKSDFFPPSRANDVEGNDTHQTATTVALNTPVTGHMGYYSAGTFDSDDYWKFTLTGNGKVVVQITADSLDASGARLDLDVSMFDINGSSYIAGDSRTGTFSECTSYLKPGTYFLRPYRATGGAGSYTMTVNYTAPPRTNDGDGNDDAATAKLLTFNVTSTGHLGYFGNGITDVADYWKFVASSNDSLYIQVTSDPGIDIDPSVYGSDGASYLAGDSRTGTYSQIGMKPTAGATYYIRSSRASGTAGSYSILTTRSSTPVGVEENSGEVVIPTQLSLDQNYPNPFNPSTTVRYGLPVSQHVRISVFSLLGQEIVTLVDAVQTPSTYSVKWNGMDRKGTEMPSGLYIIRLEAGGTQIVKKAMLVR